MMTSIYANDSDDDFDDDGDCDGDEKDDVWHVCGGRDNYVDYAKFV